MTRPLLSPDLRRATILVAALAATLVVAPSARAFCGFYVAKADASLFNEASQVVLARDGDRIVLTMSNDYQGDLKEFAIVVPVPTLLEEGQIHVGERAVLEKLDAFSAPRLVEYFDEDPCRVRYEKDLMAMKAAASPAVEEGGARARSLGVTIEASYTVGEYDILILSAKESTGLETWLVENGYRLPKGASAALQPYIRQGLKFFVAKVNLEEQAKTGFTYLRPLQVAYESPRFMLPIRLGMLNARGPQDLLVYALTREGRVETTNYRMVKVPSDVEIPPFVKDDFARFYKDMFARAWEKEGRNVVFLEHFWDMAWCDPCASDPLTPDELRRAGVFWLDGPSGPGAPPTRGQQSATTLVTRLHVRYDAAHFPEDLAFRETDDRQNFQGRYVLRHPFEGSSSCPAAETYKRELRQRQAKEAATLASLTGWDIGDIRRRAGFGAAPTTGGGERWWERIWK